MTDYLISDTKVARICQRLDAAGDDWHVEALTIADITAVHPGDATYRDRCDLRRQWGMVVNDGDAIAICPPVLYRGGDGWRGQGWSSASADAILRPLPGRYDEDAGIWHDTGE